MVAGFLLFHRLYAGFAACTNGVFCSGDCGQVTFAAADFAVRPEFSQDNLPAVIYADLQMGSGFELVFFSQLHGQNNAPEFV